MFVMPLSAIVMPYQRLGGWASPRSMFYAQRRSRHLLILLAQPPLPNSKPFSSMSSLLDLCPNSNYLLQVHARFILRGLHQNPTLSSNLIDSYANLGLLRLSRMVFASISDPSPTAYNAILRNLSKFGESGNALLVYREMALKSMFPDESSYPFVLRSCYGLKYGRMVHGHVVKLGFDSFDFVGCALVEMYRNFSVYLGDSHASVEPEPAKDYKVYFNSLISESCRNGDPDECFRLFVKMRMEGVLPVPNTMINMLRSCVDLNLLNAVKFVHSLVVVSDLDREISVSTALLSAYSKLGSLDSARLVFDKMPLRDCVVWNLMIQAYSRNGYPGKSVELLMQMVRSGVRADLFTAIAVLSAIAELKSLRWGKQSHANVIRSGSNYQVSVDNSLIDMYCKCDNLGSAQKVFDSVTNKTAISWTSMIKGFVSHDRPYDALSLFSEMRLAGNGVDSITVINILPACVNIGAFEQVKYLHGYSVKFGLNIVSSVNTALLISYAKCGCLEMAQQLFDEEEIHSKDVITWNSMISACSKHGKWSQCFNLYTRMKQSKLKPDQVTFLGLLTACVNSGFVEGGWQYFKEMKETYNFQPNQEHYACMVDLLGRAGCIDEAAELIKAMPTKPDARVWGPMLSACKMHKETGVAEFAAEKLIGMEPKNAGNYVLLSNIYAAAGKWEGVAKMRTFLRDTGLKKTPGCSWLEINGKVHEFRVADKSHPKSYDIYSILGHLELETEDIRRISSESHNERRFLN